MLASGSGKGRMLRTAQALRPRLHWRLIFFSSGELSLLEHVAEGTHKRIRGGAEVRFISIPAEVEEGFGLFEDLHGYANGHSFAQMLTENTSRYYGTAIRPWIKSLIRQKDHGAAIAQKLKRDFVEAYTPKDASGEVRRVMDVFGLLAAAGEMATAEDLTGWPKGEAEKGAHKCLEDWLKERGVNVASSDLEAGIQAVKLFLERFEKVKFEIKYVTCDYLYEGRESPRIVDRSGIREVDGRGITVWFFILPEVFRTEVCGGHNPLAIARELKKRGLLRGPRTCNTASKSRVVLTGCTRSAGSFSRSG
jgi:putative DNA primase/helicase